MRYLARLTMEPAIGLLLLTIAAVVGTLLYLVLSSITI